jgi:hypothetical protein
MAVNKCRVLAPLVLGTTSFLIRPTKPIGNEGACFVAIAPLRGEYHRASDCMADLLLTHESEHQVMVDREQRQLQAIEHAQFVEDVRKMMFHGLVA